MFLKSNWKKKNTRARPSPLAHLNTRHTKLFTMYQHKRFLLLFFTILLFACFLLLLSNYYWSEKEKLACFFLVEEKLCFCLFFRFLLRNTINLSNISLNLLFIPYHPIKRGIHVIFYTNSFSGMAAVRFDSVSFFLNKTTNDRVSMHDDDNDGKNERKNVNIFPIALCRVILIHFYINYSAV